jgi:hypothetical protein
MAVLLDWKNPFGTNLCFHTNMVENDLFLESPNLVVANPNLVVGDSNLRNLLVGNHIGRK